MSERSVARFLIPWLVILAGITFSLGVQYHVPDGVFYSGDGGAKLLWARQFAAGIWRLDLRLPFEPWVSRLWNEGLFPLRPPVVMRMGERYEFIFPAALPVLTAPFYSRFGFQGLYVLPLVSLWAVWVRLLFACRRFDLGILETSLVLVSVVFCSYLTLYGNMYWEHTIGVALSFAGVMAALLSTGRDSSVPRALAGGVLLGLAGWVRPESLWLAVLTVAVCLPGRRDHGALRAWTALTISFSLVLTAFVCFNLFHHGRPFGLHSLNVLDGSGLWGRFRAGLSLFLPSWREFLYFFPPAILAVAGGPLLFRSLPERSRGVGLRLWLLLVGFLVVTPFLIPTLGGKQWGPRYVLLAVPVAGLLAGLLLDSLRRPGGRLIRPAVLLLYGCAMAAGLWINSVTGARLLIDDYERRVLPAMRWVERSPPDVVAINFDWIALEMADLFDRKRFFLMSGPASWSRLASELTRQGRREFLYLYCACGGTPGPVFFRMGDGVECRSVGEVWAYALYTCVTGPAHSPG